MNNPIMINGEHLPMPKSEAKCDFCGREEKQATVKNLEGMTWLCPDEVWICSSCLNEKKRRITVAQK